MEIIMNNFQSLGFAVAWLLIGQQIKKRVQFFQKFCIPAPIIGGLLFALISLFGYMTKLFSFHFDTTLKDYWMVMFFTSIGFNASFSILKKGGLNVVKFLFCAVLLAVLQNVIAQGAAILIGFNRSLAVMLGSTSLTGGFGTAAAFAPIVDPDGSLGALSLAVAIPTCSSILSCLIAGPIVGHIITKYNFPKRENAPTLKVEPSGKIIKETKILKRAPQFRFLPNRANRATYIPTKDFFDTKSEVISEPHSVGDVDNSLAKTEKTLDSEKLLFSFMLLVIASGFGLFITNAFNGMFSGAKFPIYIGTMIVAAILRNIADGTKMFTVYMDEVDAIGNISLNLFFKYGIGFVEALATCKFSVTSDFNSHIANCVDVLFCTFCNLCCDGAKIRCSRYHGRSHRLRFCRHAERDGKYERDLRKVRIFRVGVFCRPNCRLSFYRPIQRVDYNRND